MTVINNATPCVDCGHSLYSHAPATGEMNVRPCDVPSCDCSTFTVGRPTAADVAPADDPVNHPSHYTSHPSGVECIEITEHMSFNVGNAIKYLWRADDKGSPIQDLEKAGWYIAREVAKRKKAAES